MERPRFPPLKIMDKATWKDYDRDQIERDAFEVDIIVNETESSYFMYLVIGLVLTGILLFALLGKLLWDKFT